MPSLADLRRDYQLSSLSENEVDANPITQFTRWFDQAANAQIPDINAMSLATVDAQGKPSCRIVLIKDIDEQGIRWFTNYESRKGQEMANNPHAALLFFWGGLERQVRIEGVVEKLSSQDNDTYFYSRPLGSQQSALASRQSQVIANRDALEAQLAQVVAQYGDQPPRPEHWGGYRLVPDYFEFWQGRSSRLHDRIAYRKHHDGTWQWERLQP